MGIDRPFTVRLLRAIAAPSVRTVRVLTTGLIVLSALAACAALVPRQAPPSTVAEQDPMAALSARMDLVRERLAEIERLHVREIAPLERTLRAYRDDTRLARRIAVALTREGRRRGLEPRLLLALLLVENPMLDPVARSPVGGVGLMQVMPQHRGQWEPCAPRLDEVEANICHGAAIFAHYLSREGSVERALLRYNGCVRGTNTPTCHAYPSWVFQRAGRASVLAWLREAAREST